MPKLADRLLYLRNIYNLSQCQLANLAGTTQQAIQQAEKGKARKPRYLNDLAHALEIPVEWMIWGEAIEEHTLAVSQTTVSEMMFKESDSEVLDHFYAMPEKDQKLILELMKSRQGQNDRKK